MKRVALALITAALLAIEFGHVPLIFAATPENSVNEVGKCTNDADDILPTNVEHKQKQLSPSMQTKNYKPIDVGLPRRRQGGGTR